MTQTAPNQAQDSKLEVLQDRLDFARKLQDLTNKIHGTDNVTQIMLDLSAEISELFQCERLTLYVYNKERGALVSKVKTGIDADKDLVLPVNRQSIAGYVAATRSTVRIDNLNDPAELERIDPELHFFNQVDTITGFKSKQMLAAPLLQGTNRELVGVLQLRGALGLGLHRERGVGLLELGAVQAIFLGPGQDGVVAVGGLALHMNRLEHLGMQVHAAHGLERLGCGAGGGHLPEVALAVEQPDVNAKQRRVWLHKQYAPLHGLVKDGSG